MHCSKCTISWMISTATKIIVILTFLFFSECALCQPCDNSYKIPSNFNKLAEISSMISPTSLTLQLENKEIIPAARINGSYMGFNIFLIQTRVRKRPGIEVIIDGFEIILNNYQPLPPFKFHSMAKPCLLSPPIIYYVDINSASINQCYSSRRFFLDGKEYTTEIASLEDKTEPIWCWINFNRPGLYTVDVNLLLSSGSTKQRFKIAKDLKEFFYNTHTLHYDKKRRVTGVTFH